MDQTGLRSSRGKTVDGDIFDLLSAGTEKPLLIRDRKKRLKLQNVKPEKAKSNFGLKKKDRNL